MSYRIPKPQTEVRKTEAFRVALATLIFEYVAECTDDGQSVLDLGQVCVLSDLLELAGVVDRVRKWALTKPLWKLLETRDIVPVGQVRSPEGVERSETLDRHPFDTLDNGGGNEGRFPLAKVPDVIALIIGLSEILERDRDKIDEQHEIGVLPWRKWCIEQDKLNSRFANAILSLRPKLSDSLKACHVIQNSTFFGGDREQ